VSRLVACYRRSSMYGWLALSATAGSLLSAWLGYYSSYSFIPCGLFAVTAIGLCWILSRPAVQLYATHLAIGRKTIAWPEIASVDSTGWMVPLVVRIGLLNGQRQVLIFPGNHTTAPELLDTLRRMAHTASIDGVPYTQYWSKRSGLVNLTAPEPDPLLRPRLLRPEDELEVEQMFQRLKSARHSESHDREQ